MFGKKFITVSSNEASIRRSFFRGFFPLGDDAYIDEVMVEAAGFDSLIIIPEIEQISTSLIDDIIEKFDVYFEANGDLPGSMLQNMASWMFAWGLEMAWRWKKGSLERVKFEQDMKTFDVPLSYFSLMPQEWFARIINSFMTWSYGHPGYTDRYEIDIYDPIRDGYLTMVRCAVTKVMPDFY